MLWYTLQYTNGLYWPYWVSHVREFSLEEDFNKPWLNSTTETSSEQDMITATREQTAVHGHVAMAKWAKACSPEEHFHLQINLFSVSNHKQGNKAQLSTTARLIPTEEDGRIRDPGDHSLDISDELAHFQ